MLVSKDTNVLMTLKYLTVLLTEEYVFGHSMNTGMTRRQIIFPIFDLFHSHKKPN